MLNTLRKNAFFLIPLFAIIVVLGVWLVTHDLDDTYTVILGTCLVLLTIGILFFNLWWYYTLLVVLIPISVNMAVVGEVELNFPSEGLLLLLLPVILFFNHTYQATFLRLCKHPITIMLFLDIILHVILSFFSTHFDISLKRTVIHIIFIGVYYVLANMLTRKTLVKPWLMYAVGILPVMVLTFIHHAEYAFSLRSVPKICHPYYDDHTIYGACLAFIIPILLILILNRRLFQFSKPIYISLILLFALIVVSELFTLSRASNISLFVALGFYILLRWKVKFSSILLLLGVLVATLFYFRNNIYEQLSQTKAVSNDGDLVNHFSSVTNVDTDASNAERINRWVCAWRMFEERPWFGFGPGTYQFEYYKYQTREFQTYISTYQGDRGNAHSEYFTYLSEMGIMGLIVFMLTIFVSIYYGMQNHYQLDDAVLKMINLGVLLGLMTYVFHGIFNSFFDQNKLAFLYFTALGTIVWINQRMKSENTE